MEDVRRLACKRCQTRKSKCDRQQPCSTCVQSGNTCEYRVTDNRKRPVSHKYLTALETRLAWFESFIKKLKASSDSERDTLLRDVTFDDHFGEKAVEKPPPNNPSSTISLKPGPSGSLQYHGPTSIYLDEDLIDPSQQNPWSGAIGTDAWSNIRLASALGIDNTIIQEVLPLFFIHQYPQFMFIYREAFLADYFDHEYGGKYWSFPLVYAICALGAVHSDKPQIRSKSPLFAKCAQEIILTHSLTRPHPTVVQALLCLAFHEVGQGNSSQGWLFSGMAFRIGQDIGFHQDPAQWMSQDKTIVSMVDIEIRRRIYWGCYVADKFISLYLGRPIYLSEGDAAVYPTEPLPDLPDDHEWFGLLELSMKQYPKHQLTSSLKYTIMLGKIFQDIMTDIFSPRPQESTLIYRLGELNLRLNRWHSELPELLQWSQWSQSKLIQQPIMILHLFYHSLCISLNRHFVRPSKGFPLNEPSKSICTASCDAIVTMTRQFRNQHDYRTTPLILIYALVMTIITIVNCAEKKSLDSRISFLMKTLEEFAQVYKLAAEARLRLISFLKIGKTSQSIPEAQNVPTTTPAYEGMGIGTMSYDNTQMETPFLDPSIEQDLFSSYDMTGDFQGWFSLGNT